MPFFLKNFAGGLGNQLFSILTIYSLAKKYKTTFSVNESELHISGINNDIVIPVYLESVFSEILKYSINLNISDYPQSISINLPQFKEFQMPLQTNTETTLIYITGLPMKYSLFSDYLDEIQDIMYRQKIKYVTEKIKDSNIRRIGIMFRTFAEEKNTQWTTIDEYYKKAIKYILEHYNNKYTLEFHIYTDQAGVTETIINPIINNLNIKVNTTEYIGIRDNKTDVEHFFAMFDLDDYILCNSTYHYWPALLSRYTDNKIVTFPSYTKDGNNISWFNHIVPPEWINL